MNSKKHILVIIVLLLAFSLYACGKTNGNNQTQDSGSTVLIKAAVDVALDLKNQDMESLSKYLSNEKGLIIAPYSNIDLKTAHKFTIDEVKGLKENTNSVVWGIYDGSGEPIDLIFSDYYKKFIFDLDFTNPNIIGVNEIIGKGNTVNNLKEVFPGSESVEFYFKGVDPKYEGLDWRSLRLGFEKSDGKYYLIYIAHDQWTI
ncbi:MAG: hypothetical protein WCF96_03290 [Eubacteriales bacterium]